MVARRRRCGGGGGGAGVREPGAGHTALTPAIPPPSPPPPPPAPPSPTSSPTTPPPSLSPLHHPPPTSTGVHGDINDLGRNTPNTDGAHHRSEGNPPAPAPRPHRHPAPRALVVAVAPRHPPAPGGRGGEEGVGQAAATYWVAWLATEERRPGKLVRQFGRRPKLCRIRGPGPSRRAGTGPHQGWIGPGARGARGARGGTRGSARG